ncbi:MAG: dipeptidase [Acidobacteriota bacterium]
MSSEPGITRRDFVLATAGVVSLLPLVGPLAASAGQVAVSDDQDREVYRRAVAIDGLATPDTFNVPWPPSGQLLSQVQLDSVAHSGLTAVNLTVSSGTFLATVRDIGRWLGRIDAHPSHLTLIRKHADLDRAKQDGKLGLILGFQGAAVLTDGLRDLLTFRQLGVRIIQLTYDTRNVFGDGCLEPANAGLSKFGRELIAQMNELGMVVDLAHGGVQTTAEAIAASTKPVILSHTGCNEVYRHPRNVDDRELRVMADRGGVVGIYLVPFVPVRPEELLLRYIEHALEVCGADHVGIGSDMSITPIDETPEYLRAFQNAMAEWEKQGKGHLGGRHFIPALNHPRRLESIAIAMAKRGHSSAVIEKVIGGNFYRVFREIWPAV